MHYLPCKALVRANPGSSLPPMLRCA